MPNPWRHDFTGHHLRGLPQVLPAERWEGMSQLRQTIVDHLPTIFEETMSYGMIGYVVPHDTYPAEYHCDPKLPLPLIHILFT